MGIMKTIKDYIVAKKTEILNGLFKTKDGLSWNETSELINELVELTQRWIPVEEELPPRNENVLLKRERPYHIYEITGFQRDGVFYSNTELPLNGKVIAWRPIELK